MTRDDIHKLIAGYATGTLTDEERQALFAAALDDQGLFDELAGEQEWKELLEEPAVRARLLESLTPAATPALAAPPPRKRRWWDRPHWTWAAAATAAAILLGVYLTQPSEPKRLAVVMPPPPVVSNAPAPVLEPPPADVPLPALPPPAAVRGSLAPPLPAPEQDLPKVEVATAAAPVPPAAATAAPKVEAPTDSPALREPVAAARLAAPIPQQDLAAAGGGGGGRGGRGGGRGATKGAIGGFAQNFADKAVAMFGFEYSVTTEGRLRIAPSANGFLSVSAAGQAVVSNRAVMAGSSNEIALPDGAASATVVFSMQAITDSILSITKNPAPTTSGTVEDPNPTAASRLEIVIPLGR